MHMFSIGFALLVSVAIIAMGTLYIVNPRAATTSFGLPLPEDGVNVAWWLRLKGVRDIVAGLVVLALMMWTTPHVVGIVLLIDALIAIGDMSLVLSARGSKKAALGMHGLTAALMIVAAIPLIGGIG
jgi:hypothetical protein